MLDNTMLDNKWAYIVLGRLRENDIWDWFGPNREYNTFIGGVYVHLRDAFTHRDTSSARHRSVLAEGRNFIAFDGDNWLVGRMALPSSALDPSIYPPDLYSTDRSGGPLRFIHSYLSCGNGFPENIPVVGCEEYKSLHEMHIIPLWDKSMTSNGRAIQEGRHKTITYFEDAINPAALVTQLPSDAIAALRKAHCDRSAILIEYDVAKKQWSSIDEAGRDWNRHKANLLSSPAPHTKPTAQTVVTPRNPLSSFEAAENTAQTAFQRLATLHWSSKLALIGGTVAIGATIAYTLYHRRSKDPQHSETRGR